MPSVDYSGNGATINAGGINRPARELGQGTVNKRLREALDASDFDEAAIAMRLGVDPKTVERWIAGRVPYPRYRNSLAGLLSADENALWPKIAQRRAAPTRESADIKAVYAHRWAVPREEWLGLFGSAKSEIAILAYAALFLAEDDGILRLLAERANAGVRVRILLGEPDDHHIAERGMEEGIDSAVGAKVKNAIGLYKRLAVIDSVEIRLHSTTLYASIYRGDDSFLINTHAYGAAAAHAPVLCIRHRDGGDIAETYLESFERVWSSARSI